MNAPLSQAILFEMEYGSKLYGTNTPSSDTDLKRIFLPSFKSLVLGHPLKNVCVKTNNVTNVRNTGEDVDVEYIPIQRLCYDFVKGQTYALEIVFGSLQSPNITWDTEYERKIKQIFTWLKGNYLTKNMSPMVGYAFNQARIYSLKGERYSVGKYVLNLIRAAQDIVPRKDWDKVTFQEALVSGVKEIGAETWNKFLENHPLYIKSTLIPATPSSEARPAWKILGGVFACNDKARNVADSMMARISKYGGRAIETTPDHADWKALMHSIRICDEAIDLLKTQHIQLPHSKELVQKYLSIRKGEIPLSDVQQEVIFKLDKVLQLESESQLPSWTPELVVSMENELADYLLGLYTK